MQERSIMIQKIIYYHKDVKHTLDHCFLLKIQVVQPAIQDQPDQMEAGLVQPDIQDPPDQPDLRECQVLQLILDQRDQPDPLDQKV